MTVWSFDMIHGNFLKLVNFTANINYPTRHLLVQSQQKNTRTMREICSNFTVKTLVRRCWSYSNFFIVNSEEISRIVLVF